MQDEKQKAIHSPLRINFLTYVFRAMNQEDDTAGSHPCGNIVKVLH